MLRIALSVFGLAWLSMLQSIASADFIEAATPSLGDSAASIAQAAGTERLVGDSAQQLWRDSAHLEAGYYVEETGLTHKRFVRPIDAAVHDSDRQVMPVTAERFEARSSDALAQCMAGVFAVLWVSGFVYRRHLLQRVRGRA